MQGYFITGTDTGVGKTYVTVLLARQFITQGKRVAALKPVASGASYLNGGLCNDDALQLQAVSNVQLKYAEVNPYCFDLPMPPHIVAAQQNIKIELSVIESQIANLHVRTHAEIILVEGVGGWHVPLNDHDTVADLAKKLQLPVLLVVGLRLGCLNHALLSAQAIIQSGCELAGWIANTIDPNYRAISETIAYLQRHLPTRYWGTVAYHAQENCSLKLPDGK